MQVNRLISTLSDVPEAAGKLTTHRNGLIAGIAIGTIALVAGIALLIFGAITANPILMIAGGACMAAGIVILTPCAVNLVRMNQKAALILAELDKKQAELRGLDAESSRFRENLEGGRSRFDREFDATRKKFDREFEANRREMKRNFGSSRLGSNFNFGF